MNVVIAKVTHGALNGKFVHTVKLPFTSKGALGTVTTTRSYYVSLEESLIEEAKTLKAGESLDDLNHEIKATAAQILSQYDVAIIDGPVDEATGNSVPMKWLVAKA